MALGMKAVRAIAGMIAICAFLVSSVLAHAGAGHAGHHTAMTVHVMQANADHHHSSDSSSHDHQKLQHDADVPHCCTIGGCGFLVIEEPVGFSVFRTALRLSSGEPSFTSLSPPPDFPPPRSLV